MSVLCKGCRKTKVNEDFGIKDNGTQYKTCITCRNKKIKKIELKEEEIIECCDAELIRDTFRKLNCRIVYLNELKYMLDLDKHLAISIFSKMIMYNNIAIIETITPDNFCPFMNLLIHLEIYTSEHIRQFGVNIVIYKNSKVSLMRATISSTKNLFDGFMKCIKLPNKKMCDICNIKKKCFRECAKCKNKMCFECFKNHNKNYVNSCPYCRYNIEEHSQMNKLMEEVLGDGIQMY